MIAQEVKGIRDGLQRVIDFVRNDAREASHRSQSLGFYQCFLGLLTIGNVGVRAKPAHNLSTYVVNRQGTGEEPTVSAILASQSKSLFPGFASCPATLDSSDDLRHVICMH